MSTIVVLSSAHIALDALGGVDIGTLDGACGFRHGTVIAYANNDNQLVDPNKADQVPTNQIAVPRVMSHPDDGQL
jgi:hypothetical protein